MYDTTAYFNKLWVIESLPQGDLRTGKLLVEGPLVLAASAHNNFKVEFRTPVTRKDFYSVLDEILVDTNTTDSLPMIHIECHGSETGIVVASKEAVEWDGLRKQFIRINESTGLNLVVVMAACYGAHILRMATEMDRAPFWAAIGAEKEVTARHVETAFKAFYQKFFETLSGDQALTALNHQDPKRTYQFISAEGFFLRAYRNYYNMACRGKGKTERVESLLTQALDNPVVRQRFGITRVRNFIKSYFRNDAKDFEEFKSRYFMFDLFPENNRRFTITHEQVLAKWHSER